VIRDGPEHADRFLAELGGGRRGSGDVHIEDAGGARDQVVDP